MTEDNIDILVISETKIDNSFPENQFSIDGYNLPYCLDRNQDGGGLLVYFRSGIPSRKLITNLPENVEGIFFDMNIRNKKWLIIVGYNPNKEHIGSFLCHVGKSLDYLIGKNENLIIIGDFNSQMEEYAMKDFCETYNFKNLITEPTCYKNAQNPSLIDLILTNKPKSFHSSMCIETGISDCMCLKCAFHEIMSRKDKIQKLQKL